MRRRIKTSTTVEIVMSLLFAFSVFMMVYNSDTLFASNWDYNEALVLKGDGDPKGTGEAVPRSIVISLEESLAAFKNPERVKIVYKEYIYGELKVKIERSEMTVYQTSAPVIVGDSLNIDITTFSNGAYTLRIEDVDGRKAYADFEIDN